LLKREGRLDEEGVRRTKKTGVGRKENRLKRGGSSPRGKEDNSGHRKLKRLKITSPEKSR